MKMCVNSAARRASVTAPAPNCARVVAQLVNVPPQAPEMIGTQT